MNLLDYDLGDAIATKKLSLQGEKKIFEVYRIPIKHLVYNKKNGRIATYVSQYLDEGNEFPEDVEQFNNIIETYIEKSNSDALKKTKANIKIMSQTEPAVVLSNGIVLDGNRRFTSLRQLSREGAGAEFNYLEAVILDGKKYNEKDIKRLELNLQHAIEARVDYNPIDRLVDIYRDLIEDDGVFTPEEYSRETQISLSKIKEDIEISKLMIDYLAFIKRPLRFHIARDQKIDGPIREIHKILKSNRIDVESKDDIQEFLFLNIMSLSGDISRKIRDLRPVIEDKQLGTELLEEIDETEILDDAVKSFSENSNNETVSLDIKIQSKVSELTEGMVERKKIQNAKNQPFEILNKSFKILKEIDLDSLNRLEKNSKQEFHELLIQVANFVEELKNI